MNSIVNMSNGGHQEKGATRHQQKPQQEAWGEKRDFRSRVSWTSDLKAMNNTVVRADEETETETR